MFENERQTLLIQQTYSPRCQKLRSSRPSNQFYSWKNYVNSDVTAMYNEIKSRDHPIELMSNVGSTGVSRNREAFTDRNGINEHYGNLRKLSEDRNCFSKVRITGKKSSKEEEMNSRSSYGSASRYMYEDDVLIGKRDDRTTMVSMGLENNGKVFKKNKDQGVNTMMNMNSNSEVSSNHQLLHSKLNISKELDIFQNGNGKQFEKGLDLYHLQLKEEERLYLMSKFMEHYEGVHGKKM